MIAASFEVLSSQYYSRLSSVLKSNKMDPQVAQQDDYSHESFTPETLQQLREWIHSFVSQQESSYQTLQTDFQEHMETFSEAGLLQGQKGWKLSEFLLGLKERLEQKSRNMGCLAQVGLKMIDYLNEQRYRQSLVISRFEEAIQQLQQQNMHLSSKNVTIENDVEYFRERLQATEVQLEKIVTQESEECVQELLSSSRQESQRDKQESQRDKQIQLLQKELGGIREEIELYRRGHLRGSNNHTQDTPKFVRTSSQHSIFQEHSNSHMEAQLAQSKKMIEKLQSENIRLQRELDITQNKVRSRKSSNISVEIRENKLIELTPQQAGEQRERKNYFEQEVIMHFSPSGFSLMEKGNLQGDIKQSLKSSNSHFQVSNRMICVSSNRSLFANLEMRDLVKDQEQYLGERESIRRLPSLQVDGVLVAEKQEKSREKMSVSVNTEFVNYCEKSTMTRQNAKPSLIKRLILLPVKILVCIIWRKESYGMGCLG